ncbi:MAG: hypothetical protein H5T86_15295, partial [Armatimonadetes bacterium]|nr:hypothetical protein [Armatimonadota bacterium]
MEPLSSTILAATGLLVLATAALAQPDPVRDIGSRLELFVDDWLIAELRGVQLRLHHPTPQEICLQFNEPWEGSTCAYVTAFQDGQLYRMYYRGSDFDWGTRRSTHPEFACYAESTDGIHWTKPKLGLFEFRGSKDNNIIWAGPGCHNFTPFKDTNPRCPPDARYKALGLHNKALLAFKSPDGIHWSLLREEPVITHGAFDSQNLAFWDPIAGCYRAYYRGFRDGVRDILTATSPDFINWDDEKQQWLDYGDAPKEHLYTNAIQPYFRAPHILLGFPNRF